MHFLKAGLQNDWSHFVQTRGIFLDAANSSSEGSSKSSALPATFGCLPYFTVIHFFWPLKPSGAWQLCLWAVLRFGWITILSAARMLPSSWLWSRRNSGNPHLMHKSFCRSTSKVFKSNLKWYPMNHHPFAGIAESSTLRYSDAGKFAFVHWLSTRKANNSATSLFGRKNKNTECMQPFRDGPVWHTHPLLSIPHCSDLIQGIEAVQNKLYYFNFSIREA